MDYKKLTAPCGIPCFECGAYKATTNEKYKQYISSEFGMDYDKSSCEGCRSKNGKGFLSEKNNVFPDGKCSLLNEKGLCKIYLCTEKRQIHNCSECPNFPCNNLQPSADKADKIPHNLKIYNLCLIKKSGLEKWAKEKAGTVVAEYKTKKFNNVP